MLRECQTLTVLAACLVLAACGSGKSEPGTDPGPSDPGPSDPGYPPDIPMTDVGSDPGQDLHDPGTDVPDTDPGPDVPDVPTDPGDPGDPGGDPGDPGPDVPDLPDVTECTKNEDCEGLVGVLAPCEFAECNDGSCRKGTSPDDTPCDDGDFCTHEDICKLGQCTGIPLVCNDDESCTVDSCLAGTGCVFDPIEGPCDDLNACTESDQCVAGQCVGSAVDCDDSEPCTVDTCDTATGCQHQPLMSGDCDDGSLCTLDDQCVEGQCTGTPLECGDDNLCTTDTCDPAVGCQYAPTQSQCDDGLDCTEGDQCVDMNCVGTNLDCEDGDTCTDDGCEEGTGCVHTPNTSPCDDLSPCTIDDTCSEGACLGTPKVCDQPPDNGCLDDWTAVTYSDVGICNVDGVCDYLPQEIDCNPDNCVDGACPGDPCEGVDCTVPPGPCFAPGTCTEGSCSYPYADNEACDDENPCTEGDLCDTGVCSGAPMVCNAPPPDTCLDATTLQDFQLQGACDQQSGLCEYPFDEVTCGSGCVDGTCIESLGLLQSALTPGGLVGITSENHGLSCVMPGWYESGTMGSTVHILDAGFQP